MVSLLDMSVLAPPESAPWTGPRPLDISIRSLRSPTTQGRSENQDNYLYIDSAGLACLLWGERETHLRLRDWPAGHRRLAVLDGMGGHCHGREATENTVEGLLDVPAATELGQLSPSLEALHRRLHRQFQAQGWQSGCTLLLLEIPPCSPALLFHVGDSRLYAVSAHQTRCLTVDHVPATHLAMLGLVDSIQWWQQVHGQANSQISQAFVLGSTLGICKPQAEAITEALFELHEGNLPLFLRGLGDRRALSLDPGWVYLLASDGLWHLTDPQAFIRRWPSLLGDATRSLDALADDLLTELTEEIRQQHTQPDDNCTFILARCPTPRLAHQPFEDVP